MKTVDFSDIFSASDLKVSRSRHLIEYMKVCEFEGQGHFLTFAQGSCTYKNSNRIFSETTVPI